MDDLTLFADSRSQLVEARAALAAWLLEERRLRLKHPSAPVRSTRSRFRYLGYQVSRTGIEPTAALLRRMREKVGAALLAAGDGRIERSLASYGGVLGFGLAGRCSLAQPQPDYCVESCRRCLPCSFRRAVALEVSGG